MKEPIHINCSCGSEELRVQYDEEIDSYDVAIFTLQLGKRSWKDRFRMIWKIIKDGQPFGDQMVVDRKEMNKLSEYLYDVSTEKMKSYNTIRNPKN